MTTPSPSPSSSPAPGLSSSPAHHALRARSFDTAAAQYAANRPSYPTALLDEIEAVAGHPLAGARVIDVGAGTGISTALLHARGARVVGVEPGEGMAAEFHRGLPDVPVVRGDGNALPFADGSADFVTYAQSWHWTEPARAVPEALRVLRPGGSLALWWNTNAVDVPWIARQGGRIQRHFGIDRVGGLQGAAPRTAAADPTGSLDFTPRTVRWSRRVPVDTHLANIGSHSVFLVLGEEGAAAFLTEERGHLLAEFPDGFVEETYVVELLVAARP
ncbi:class I SAM-dependent methyltransferase [Streptomyces sp. NPDC094437]|uniref:class I SAM-dependent methyltransferase n=1 Tax=Streptomyces sp. NPDC094437 TaxID=3366060 RepID=UPI00382B2C40